jgi:hypothetical protein
MPLPFQFNFRQMESVSPIMESEMVCFDMIHKRWQRDRHMMDPLFSIAAPFKTSLEVERSFIAKAGRGREGPDLTTCCRGDVLSLDRWHSVIGLVRQF